MSNASELASIIKTEIQSSYNKIMKMMVEQEPRYPKEQYKNPLTRSMEFLFDTMDMLVAGQGMKKIIVMTDSVCVEDLTNLERIFLRNFHFTAIDFVITGDLSLRFAENNGLFRFISSGRKSGLWVYQQ